MVAQCTPLDGSCRENLADRLASQIIADPHYVCPLNRLVTSFQQYSSKAATAAANEPRLVND